MTEVLNSIDPEVAKRLKEVYGIGSDVDNDAGEQSHEPDTPESPEVDQYLVSEEELTARMRNKDIPDGDPIEAAVSATVERIRTGEVPVSDMYHSYSQELMLSLAASDMPKYEGKESKARQLDRIAEQRAASFDDGATMLESRLEAMGAFTDSEESQKVTDSSNDTESKTSTDAPEHVQAPSKDKAQAELTESRPTAHKSERSESTATSKEKSLESFGMLREEGLDSKLKVIELRKLAAQHELYDQVVTKAGKKFTVPYGERRSRARSISSQHFDTLYPASDITSKQERDVWRGRRELFTGSATHLMLLSESNFDKAWLAYRDLTNPDRDKPSQQQPKQAESTVPVEPTQGEKKRAPGIPPALEDMEIVEKFDSIETLQRLRFESRMGVDYEQLSDDDKMSRARDLAERHYHDVYPESRDLVDQNKSLQDKKRKFVDRYVSLIMLSDGAFAGTYAMLEQRKAHKTAPATPPAPTTVNTAAPSGQNHAQTHQKDLSDVDPLEPLPGEGDTFLGGFQGTSERGKTRESWRKGTQTIRERIGTMALSRYHAVSAYGAERAHKRQEKRAHMTEAERQKEKRNKLIVMGAAIGAVAVWSLYSKFGGGFDMFETSGHHGDKRTPQTIPPLDRDDTQGATTSPGDKVTGYQPNQSSEAPKSVPGHEFTPKSEGPGARIDSTDLGGGSDGDTLSRNELFDGNRGSRSLTSENQARLDNFIKDYKVKDGDTVWKIAEKHLEAQGVKNPTVFEIDATKDQILKSTGLKANSTLHIGKQLGK